MREFLAFIKRFQIFLFFVLLQGISLSFYFSNVNFPKSQYLTSASNINGWLFSWEKYFTSLFDLGNQNRQLQKEYAHLKEKNPVSFHQINRQYYKIEDTLYKQRYNYISGEIIQSGWAKRNNYFTINVGKKQGVKRGMGVFSTKGVVGVVSIAGTHFSVVKSLLTENINLDVMNIKTGAFGILKWDGKHPRFGTIYGVSNDIKLKKWSEIVTRGESGIFPKGLKVGKIAKIKAIEGKPLWEIKVLFSEDFRTTQYVFVIKHLMQNELEELIRKIPQDKVED
ncbi:MAG: rod shape-determining protein MreC [Flavobacteriia bacterium]|nr:rod shape-determining protein MreC [Flavobacteriia bacterium]